MGESERAVRALFARGRASAPCVVFFDELDALVPRRGGDSSSQASERVVNQMLTEMDGLDGRRQVRADPNPAPDPTLRLTRSLRA